MNFKFYLLHLKRIYFSHLRKASPGVPDSATNFSDSLRTAKTGAVEETVEDFHGRHKTMKEWKYCRFIMVIGSLTVLFLVGRLLELPLKKTIIGKLGKAAH